MIKERSDAIIETTYEVIRFVERGNHCHPVMDCVPGQLLIYRVQQESKVEKNQIFKWLKELAEQLEFYHRWKRDQPYRYLNPYSVLVTKDEEIVLLDMEAQSNEFVLRNMQKQAMRNHFVKPIVHMKENTRQQQDLYAYGKTVQFLLANVSASPALTKREEYRLSKVIEKCLGEHPKKKYEEVGQIQKELPVVKTAKPGTWKRTAAGIGVAVCLAAACAAAAVRIQREQDRTQQVREQLELQAGANQKLEQSNQQLAAEKDQLSAENQQLFQENENLKTEKQTMQAENDSLKAENAGLKQQIQSLQGENQGQQENQAENPAEGTETPGVQE